VKERQTCDRMHSSVQCSVFRKENSYEVSFPIKLADAGQRLSLFEKRVFKKEESKEHGKIQG
jgi:hypothetical protein